MCEFHPIIDILWLSLFRTFSCCFMVSDQINNVVFAEMWIGRLPINISQTRWPANDSSQQTRKWQTSGGIIYFESEKAKTDSQYVLPVEVFDCRVVFLNEFPGNEFYRKSALPNATTTKNHEAVLTSHNRFYSTLSQNRVGIAGTPSTTELLREGVKCTPKRHQSQRPLPSVWLSSRSGSSSS